MKPSINYVSACPKGWGSVKFAVDTFWEAYGLETLFIDALQIEVGVLTATLTAGFVPFLIRDVFDDGLTKAGTIKLIQSYAKRGTRKEKMRGKGER